MWRTTDSKRIGWESQAELNLLIWNQQENERPAVGGKPLQSKTREIICHFFQIGSRICEFWITYLPQFHLLRLTQQLLLSPWPEMVRRDSCIAKISGIIFALFIIVDMSRMIRRISSNFAQMSVRSRVHWILEVITLIISFFNLMILFFSSKKSAIFWIIMPPAQWPMVGCPPRDWEVNHCPGHNKKHKNGTSCLPAWLDFFLKLCTNVYSGRKWT